MQPFISIIIPTLNEEKFLPRLLKNLKSQTKKNFEVIVVDAHSTDKTVECTKKFRDNFPIRIFQSQLQNVSSQRNLGAKKARGTYLFFIDADAQVDRSIIRTVTEVIHKTNYLIIIPKMLPEKNGKREQLFFNVSNYAIELSQMTVRPLSSSGTIIIEKHIFEHVGRFDVSLFIAEDHEFVARAKKFGIRALYSKKIQFKFSLRRFEKEGVLHLLGKYSVSSFHTLISGRLDKKLFEYEMGGARYDQKEIKGKVNEFKKLYKRLVQSFS